MDLQLKGRKVFVTGSTRGIGRAIAERFAAEGCQLAICSRNAGQVAETARSLEAKGAKVFARAVEEVTAAARRLVEGLETHAPPKNREEEARKAKERSLKRFA